MEIDDVQIRRYLRLYGRAPGAALEERIKAMREAAKMMEYEYAALLRDQIIELRGNGL